MRTVPASFLNQRAFFMGNYHKWLAIAGLIAIAFTVFWAGGMFATPETSEALKILRAAATTSGPAPAGAQQATFGEGCFWCAQAEFLQLRGVYSVLTGYSGGSAKDPSYEQVCAGTTGHAEAVQITFDPTVISFPELLEVFWRTHDPTTPNRQGRDVGPQYRSVIFYHTPEQKTLAEQYKQKLDKSGVFAAPIVSEIVPFVEFHEAAASHQNYYLEHPQQSYFATVIRPKLEEFAKVFRDKLKTPSSRQP